MLQALKPLLDQCKALDIKLLSDADTITVMVFPTPKEGQKDAALTQPLKLVGTVDEMEAQFAELIQSTAEKRGSLIDSVEALGAILDAAKKETDKKAVSAIAGKKPGKPASTAASPATPAGDDDESDDGDQAGTNNTAAAPTTAATAQQPMETDNLFG